MLFYEALFQNGLFYDTIFYDTIFYDIVPLPLVGCVHGFRSGPLRSPAPACPTRRDRRTASPHPAVIVRVAIRRMPVVRSGLACLLHSIDVSFRGSRSPRARRGYFNLHLLGGLARVPSRDHIRGDRRRDLRGNRRRDLRGDRSRPVRAGDFGGPIEQSVAERRVGCGRTNRLPVGRSGTLLLRGRLNILGGGLGRSRLRRVPSASPRSFLFRRLLLVDATGGRSVVGRPLRSVRQFFLVSHCRGPANLGTPRLFIFSLVWQSIIAASKSGSSPCSRSQAVGLRASQPLFSCPKITYANKGCRLTVGVTNATVGVNNAGKNAAGSWPGSATRSTHVTAACTPGIQR